MIELQNRSLHLKLTCLSAFLFFMMLGYGQNSGSISGVIIDKETKSPVEYATAALYSHTDSSLVLGTITKENGAFKIENIKSGKYYLKIQFMGYEPFSSPTIHVNKIPVDLDFINLKKSSFAIDEIKVTSQKAIVEYKIEKKIINISRQLAATGGSAIDAIKNIPSVETTIEGDVKLRGSTNFVLLIDGKPTLINASDMLNQIPASTIEKIEIITNPSAKYEPDGTSGIINVILKKNALQGISGMINLSGGTGTQMAGDATLNYRTKKFEISAGFELNDHNIMNYEKGNRQTFLSDTTVSLSIDDNGNRFNNKNSFKSGFKYQISKKNTLSFSGIYSNLKIGHETTSKNHQFTNFDRNGLYSLSSNSFKIQPKLLETSFGNEYVFDSTGTHKLNFNLMMVHADVETNEHLDKYCTNETYTENLSLFEKTKRQATENVQLFDIDLDYLRPVGLRGTIETGYQAKIFNSSNNFMVFSFDQTSGNFQPDNSQSNAVVFSRNIHALYGTLAFQIRKWELKTGLRVEYTDQVLTQMTMDKRYNYQKLDFYPSIYLSRQLKSEQQLQISYSRRTDRPQTQFLNPYVIYSDGYTAVKGNPELMPDFTDAYELNYQKRFGASYISVEPYFRQTKNKITRVQELDDHGVLIRTMKNLNNEYAMGIEITGGIKPVRWLEITPRATWFKYHLDGNYETSEIIKNSQSWRLGLSTDFLLKSNTSIQLNGSYDGPNVTLEGDVQGFYYVGVAIRQYLLKRKAIVSVRAEDIFDSRHIKFSSATSKFNQTSNMFVSAPQIVFAITYKFNNYGNNKQKSNNMENQFSIY